MKGVYYLHLKGFAHRDIKIDNLMFNVETKELKIIDFGFSVFLSGN